ncbi:MAG: response regulator [Curvibacter sp.]|nr:response regulator [Curvibacter sp.]
MSQRILIVDDQAQIRQLIRFSLEDEDYQLREANSGAQALSTAMDFQPHLVLLDIMMPGGIDGLDVCREFKNRPEYGQPKVLILSAMVNQEAEDGARQAGARAFIGKPFSPAKLCKLVQALLTPVTPSTPGKP